MFLHYIQICIKRNDTRYLWQVHHVGWISSSSGCLSITFVSKDSMYRLSRSQDCSLSRSLPTS